MSREGPNVVKTGHKPSPKSPYMGGINHQTWGGL
jgi:hypothetical protein